MKIILLMLLFKKNCIILLHMADKWMLGKEIDY